MGRDGAPAREISFVSLVASGPKVSDSALPWGVTTSETRQGGFRSCNNGDPFPTMVYSGIRREKIALT